MKNTTRLFFLLVIPILVLSNPGNSLTNDKPSIKKEHSIIRVISDPPGAQVFMNGRLVGQTPLDYIAQDTTMDYKILLRKPQYFWVYDTLRVHAGELLESHYTMNRCGRILIPYDPQAKVYVNDRSINESEQVFLHGNNWVLEPLAFDRHIIRIEKPYYPPFELEAYPTEKMPRVAVPEMGTRYGMLIISRREGFSKGKLYGNGLEKRFSVLPYLPATLKLPYGNYLVKAKGKHLRYFEETVAVSSTKPVHLELSFTDVHLPTVKFLSFLFPGAGQLVTGHWAKGLIISGMMVASVGTMYDAHVKYENEYVVYRDFIKAYLNTGSLDELADRRRAYLQSQDLLQTYHRQFVLALYVAAGTYVWNLLDIQRLGSRSTSEKNVDLLLGKLGGTEGVCIQYERTF